MEAFAVAIFLCGMVFLGCCCCAYIYYLNQDQQEEANIELGQETNPINATRPIGFDHHFQSGTLHII
jgi:hypothetical protein